jgi:hypothetical protein
MKATNAQMSEQLSVKVEGGQVKISIGIALLAFAVQYQNDWPEEFYVSDIREFSQSLVRQLRREQEDGTTPVHRLFDAAAQEVIGQGDDGVDEGNVETGIALAKAYLDAKDAASSASETDFDTSRNVSDDEIEQWAATRADDAGYLSRKLIAAKRRELDREMFNNPAPAPITRGWQDISTVPKGQSVIICTWWKHSLTSAFRAEGYLDRDTKTWRNQDGSPISEDRTQPTHWQALPAAPASEGLANA